MSTGTSQVSTKFAEYFMKLEKALDLSWLGFLDLDDSMVKSKILN